MSEIIEKVIVDKADLVAIADKVREVNGTTAEMSFDEMLAGVNSLGSGGNSEDLTEGLQEQSKLIAEISTLLETKTAYRTIHIGATVPTDDIGINGDIYILRGES